LPEVKCSVDSCYYWDKGNICGADAIEVASNFAVNADMEAGMLGKDSSTSNETQCVTFKPKEKKKS
jgi:hypothetical protein